MTSTKLSTASTSLSSGNIQTSQKQGTSSTQTTSSRGSGKSTGASLTLENEVSLVEGMDEYMAWRATYPVGALLAKRIERNTRLPVRSTLHEVHLEEQAHIAKPIDYYCTKPDEEVRYQV